MRPHRQVARLFSNLLHELGGIQLTFQQVGQIMIHQGLDFQANLWGWVSHRRLDVIAALKMAHILQGFLAHTPGKGVRAAICRAEDSAQLSGKILIFRLDFFSARGAFEQKRSEPQQIQQAHLVEPHRDEWVFFAAQSFQE